MSVFHYCLALVVLTTDLQLGKCQEVSTKNGRVRGATISVLNKDVDVFYGIPFAKPPVGNLRFKHPQPSESWSPDVLSAIQETPSCLQPLDAFTFPEDYRQTPGNLSEDCLYISLWRSSNVSAGSNLSVMFWIYGGGWGLGSTNVPLYNGQYLAAENDVIVVSANYRVGPLGFGYHSQDTIPGNMGLLDQVMALKWVKDNIYNFGGDPDKITIFGESAGGVAVGLHLVSPLSRDLFKYAILQSGSPVQTLGRHVFQDDVTARSALTSFADNVGCRHKYGVDLLTCLQSVDADAITPAFMKGLTKRVAHGPVIDRYFLTEDPLTSMKTGAFKKTNIMQGFTKDESTVLLYPILKNLTRDGVSRGKYLEIMPQYTELAEAKYDKQAKALRIFYEDLQDPLTPLNYINILNDIRNDLHFSCRAVSFSSYFAVAGRNGSFMYMFSHRMSTSMYPYWVGATHSYELEFVFGLPLNKSLGFTQEERELSRKTMTHWTNFAKSGDPNLPVQLPAKWIPFDNKLMSYMRLDVGNYMATWQRLRHQQCTFINKILPVFAEDDVSHKEPYPHYYTYPQINSSPNLWRLENTVVIVLWNLMTMLTSTFMTN